MKKNNLGYIKISSPIHNLNPIIKILYFILYLGLCFLPNNHLFITLASFILVLYLIINSKVPVKLYLSNIWKFKLVILTMYIILASFRFTLIASTILVLKVVFGLLLYNMIIYTTKPFDLAYAIFSFFKPFNILGLNENRMFVRIYNLVLFRYQYARQMGETIEGLENKGKSFYDKNIISRFFIKMKLSFPVFKKIKVINRRRRGIMFRHKFSVKKYYYKLTCWDIVYLLLFVMLLGIYIVKVA